MYVILDSGRHSIVIDKILINKIDKITWLIVIYNYYHAYIVQMHGILNDTIQLKTGCRKSNTPTNTDPGLFRWTEKMNFILTTPWSDHSVPTRGRLMRETELVQFETYGVWPSTILHILIFKFHWSKDRIPDNLYDDLSPIEIISKRILMFLKCIDLYESIWNPKNIRLYYNLA